MAEVTVFLGAGGRPGQVYTTAGRVSRLVLGYFFGPGYRLIFGSCYRQQRPHPIRLLAARPLAARPLACHRRACLA